MARRPTERQLRALSKIQRIEEGQQAAVNPGYAEECEKRGWVEAQPGGGYRLMYEGRRILDARGRVGAHHFPPIAVARDEENSGDPSNALARLDVSSYSAIRTSLPAVNRARLGGRSEPSRPRDRPWPNVGEAPRLRGIPRLRSRGSRRRRSGPLFQSRADCPGAGHNQLSQLPDFAKGVGRFDAHSL